MILKKIQNYLILSFIFFLVFAQSAFFVNIKHISATGIAVGNFLSPDSLYNAISFDESLDIIFETTNYGNDDVDALGVLFSIHENRYSNRVGNVYNGEYSINRDTLAWKITIPAADLLLLDKDKKYSLKAQFSTNNGKNNNYDPVYINISHDDSLSLLKDDVIDNEPVDGFMVSIYSFGNTLKTSDIIFVSLGSSFDNKAMPKLVFQNMATQNVEQLKMGSITKESIGYFKNSATSDRLNNSNDVYYFSARVPTESDFYKDGKYKFWAEVAQKTPQARDDGNDLGSGINILRSDIKTALVTFSTRDDLPNILIEDDLNNDEEKQLINIRDDVNCIELGVFKDNDCQQFLALTGDQIDHKCIEAEVYEVLACEEYLRVGQVEQVCQQENISDFVECKDFVLEKYISTVECALDDEDLCVSILKDKYFNRLVVKKDRQEKIASSTQDFFGENISLSELNKLLQDNYISETIQPLIPVADIRVLLAESTEKTILESEEQLTIRNKAIMILDNDGDGLSDDAEKYYGTDPNKVDSDGDGFSDAEEIKNGYNPVGDGLFDQFMSNLDIVLTTGKELEQPNVLYSEANEDFEFKMLLEEDKNIKLSGVAAPNTWVNIFLYSDLPLVMTARADDSGNWVYDLKHSLVDGGHKVYVTVNDDTGKIVKQSNPLAFLVKSAQAVTADQYFQDDENIAGGQYSMLWTYILGAIFLIIFGLVFIFILHHQNKKRI